MDFELFNEILSASEDVNSYLNSKERDFNKLSTKLIGIGQVVSVDSIAILSSLTELQVEMERIHNEYVQAKEAIAIISSILNAIKVGVQVDESVERFRNIKNVLLEKGIIKSLAVNERDANRLNLKNKTSLI